MKKIILSLSLCVSIILILTDCTGKGANKSAESDNQSAVTDNQSAVIEIPDADFKAYLLENFDADKDGNLSRTEADAITAISCPNLEIASLTGIEEFKNLESLDCHNNKIIELELRYNKKLNRLICTGNGNIAPDDSTMMPLQIYIGMSSPLRNPNVRKPQDNAQPGAAELQTFPLDVKKCICDYKTTQIFLSFVD